MLVLNIFGVLLQFFIIFFTAYQATISISGLLKRAKKSDAKLSEQNRFAVLVCAHNEEAVIGQSAKNLQQLKYPKSHYDVYVIADNCTDSTATVARENGAIAMERHDTDLKGKGYALEWMFGKLWSMEEKGLVYDAVVVLDADNLVSSNFLNVMNEKLANGHEVCQAYLGVKNPKDTWVTKSYAYAYWTTNRMYQLSREKIGLSAQLGGTGMMLSTKVLKEIGWDTNSLTEDLEFTAKYILKTGKTVGWAHDAKIFDEKPLELAASMKQRVRWMIGHVNCLIKYLIPLIKSAIKKESLVHFDMAVYLVQPARTVLALSQVMFIILSLVGLDYFYVLNHWVWLSIVIISYVILPTISIILEEKSKSILWLVISYLFSLSWIPIILWAFIKRKETSWSHTKHTRTLSDEELNSFEI
ncbi:glycosyltransferase family 2 protein [Bacillus sp. ISL-41]|uniref:glycosyltransferase family 2 protein n=1 Tax=Bacillus sp. ISL-41 TaxID=2819127 RepID=UPI001BE91C21|nr:glycosyltransferase family 2 protein [Bacillus sp. ISL-41]MBT2643625.1 glycosyltransferase family 2 protein [Bacillus sp. ISL-41]